MLIGFVCVGGFILRVVVDVIGVVMMRIKSVEFYIVFDIVCESLGCEWLIDGKSLIVLLFELVCVDFLLVFGEEIIMSF